MTDTQQEIVKVCEQIKELLLEKNRNYGDSALNPTRIFSKANPIEQIYVRIDDKLSRISKGKGLLGKDEDVINDLIGYLILAKIAITRQEEKWDGTDIEPANSALRDTYGIYFDNGKKLPKLNDSEWLDMYASGDKFA